MGRKVTKSSGRRRHTNNHANRPSPKQRANHNRDAAASAGKSVASRKIVGSASAAAAEAASRDPLVEIKVQSIEQNYHCLDELVTRLYADDKEAIIP